jgi:hypothetical protein
MQNKTKIFLSLAIIILCAIADSAFAQSCPMCKESMTQAGAKLSDGFYYSIMSMFTLPISLIGAGTLFVAKRGWIKQHPEASDYSTWQVVKAMVKERRKS